MSAILKRLIEEDQVTCIDGVASNADANGVVLWCDACDNIRFFVDGATTGAPIATIEIWFSEDKTAVEADAAAGSVGPGLGTAKWQKVNIDPGAVHGSNYTPFTAAQDHIDWNGAAALDIGINLNDPFTHMCPVYNRGSGGSASTGKITIRAAGRRRATR